METNENEFQQLSRQTGKSARNATIAFWLSAGAAALLFILLISFPISWLKLQLSIARESRREATGSPFDEGNMIIAKIELYKSKVGSYPAKLDELVPEFLDEVPGPSWGVNRWEYEQWDANFELYVEMREGDYKGHYYSSTSKSWHFRT